MDKSVPTSDIFIWWNWKILETHMPISTNLINIMLNDKVSLVKIYADIYVNMYTYLYKVSFK